MYVSFWFIVLLVADRMKTQQTPNLNIAKGLEQKVPIKVSLFQSILLTHLRMIPWQTRPSGNIHWSKITMKLLGCTNFRKTYGSLTLYCSRCHSCWQIDQCSSLMCWCKACSWIEPRKTVKKLGKSMFTIWEKIKFSVYECHAPLPSRLVPSSFDSSGSADIATDAKQKMTMKMLLAIMMLPLWATRSNWQSLVNEWILLYKHA